MSTSPKSYKNLRNVDYDLVIKSDDEDDEDTLNLISQNLSSIPPYIASNKLLSVTTLILTNNVLQTLNNLKYFKNLISLQLDRNQLKHIDDFPQLHKLTTLWLNNNNLNDLHSLLPILQKQVLYNIHIIIYYILFIYIILF